MFYLIFITLPCVSEVFTAPRAGVYMISFSYEARNDPGEGTWVYVYKNSGQMRETGHHTYYRSGGSGRLGFTGGRTLYQSLEAGDTITLQTGGMSGEMYDIMMCVEFINN